MHALFEQKTKMVAKQTKNRDYGAITIQCHHEISKRIVCGLQKEKDCNQKAVRVLLKTWPKTLGETPVKSCGKFTLS